MKSLPVRFEDHETSFKHLTPTIKSRVTRHQDKIVLEFMVFKRRNIFSRKRRWWPVNEPYIIPFPFDGLERKLVIDNNTLTIRLPSTDEENEFNDEDE